MTRLPSLGYNNVIGALQRDVWVVIRQKGSHIRLHKHTRMEVLKLTVPAHSPIKRSTLAHILNKLGLPRRNLSRCFETEDSLARMP